MQKLHLILIKIAKDLGWTDQKSKKALIVGQDI